MKKLFTQRKAIVGMIHVGALPGAPRYDGEIGDIIDRVADEARIYTKARLDGLMIENMHDLPYLKGAVGPEIVAAMTLMGLTVHEVSPLPLGVQILAAANREALAVAHACGASFIRVENFAYAHVADEGLMLTAEAGPLLRYRKQIGAEHVKIIADVKKKHSSHAITADVSLAETAHTAEFCGADAIVVTGAATGQPTSPADVAAVREAVDVPVCIGSGVTTDNLADLWPHADVFIVGSHFKRDGLWSNTVDADRVGEFMRVVADLRERS